MKQALLKEIEETNAQWRTLGEKKKVVTDEANVVEKSLGCKVEQVMAAVAAGGATSMTFGFITNFAPSF